MIKFTIYGTLPCLNDYTRASRGKGWAMSARMKKTAQEQCEWAILQQCKGKHLDSCHVGIEWYEPNHRRDPDNIFFAKKFIFDALVVQKVLDNDGQKQILSISECVKVDKLNPRIEVTLRESSG